MKKLIILVGILSSTLISSVASANTICANMDTHYTVWSYQGGAAPPRGHKVYDAKFTYQGQVLMHQKRYVGQNTISDLGVAEVAGTKDVIWSETDPNRVSGSSVYEVTVELYSQDGSDVMPGVHRLQQRVICKNTWAFYP